MQPSLLFTELASHLGDEVLRPVAERTAASLRELPEGELSPARTSPAAFEAIFGSLWERYVEPDAEHSVNRGQDMGPDEEAYVMAQQGVVIDHLIRLFAAGGEWRERAERLVLAGQP